MLLLKKLAFTSLFAVFAMTLANPSPADAHGIGGPDASPSISTVQSIVPTSNNFSIESIENGERVLLQRTGSVEIIVLGIDNEEYIKLNAGGVFINQKSATRLINDSGTETLSPERVREIFGETNPDPAAEPQWVKQSNSDSYRWHDHRAHFMGEVPDGITDLGTNSIAIKADNVGHQVTFELTGGAPPPWPIYLLAFLLSAIATLVVVYRFTSFAERLFNSVTLTMLALVAIVNEIAHSVGYITFVHASLFDKITQSFYGITVITVFIALIYVLFKNRKKPTAQLWRNHAPLICVAGVVGLMAGALLEISSITQPYPASTLAPGVLRIVITTTAIISAVFIVIGLKNIKPDCTSDLEKEQTSSLP